MGMLLCCCILVLKLKTRLLLVSVESPEEGLNAFCKASEPPPAPLPKQSPSRVAREAECGCSPAHPLTFWELKHEDEYADQ